MNIISRVGYLLVILGCLCYYSTPAYARCVRVIPYINGGCYSCGVNPGFNKITVTDNYLQPVGTSLGTSIFNISNGNAYNNPNRVLYQCDLDDADKIYEQFATNGADRAGGFFDLGANDGNPNYYGTYFPYVGIKLTHLQSGTVFTRNWQSVPLTSYEIVGNKINIRVKDFSPIKAELIKVSQTPPLLGAVTSLCGIFLGSTTINQSYSCSQPNGYITFVGPGINGEVEGSDSAFHRLRIGTGRWNAIGMGNSPRTSIAYNATCVARSVTPTVVFPMTSVDYLTKGGVIQRDFNVTVECSNRALSGISSNTTAIGIQTSYPAFIAAQQLGLVNGYGAVSYLLSDDYDTDFSTAKGVGIKLSNSTTGTPMNFLGWDNCISGSCPLSNNAGWYPVLLGAQSNGSSQTGYTNYNLQFTATLTQIPGQTVKAGKIKSTAYVLVRLQ